MSPLDLEAVFEKVTPEPGSPGASRLRMGLRARLGADRPPAPFDRVLATDDVAEELPPRALPAPPAGLPKASRVIDVGTTPGLESWLAYTRSGFGIPLVAGGAGFQEPGAFLDMRA